MKRGVLKPAPVRHVFVDLDRLNKGPLLRKRTTEHQLLWHANSLPLRIRLAMLAQQFPHHSLTLYENLTAPAPSIAFLLHDEQLLPHSVLGAVTMHVLGGRPI